VLSNPPNTGPDFNARVVFADGELVVVLRGEVDTEVVDHVWDCVERASAGGAPLVLDCSRVTFMGSAGLHVFFRAYRELGRRGRAVVVRNPTAQVRRMLDVGGLHDILTVEVDGARVGATGAAGRHR
jgi:anti-anti-sigma factor